MAVTTTDPLDGADTRWLRLEESIAEGHEQGDHEPCHGKGYRSDNELERSFVFLFPRCFFRYEPHGERGGQVCDIAEDQDWGEKQIDEYDLQHEDGAEPGRGEPR